MKLTPPATPNIPLAPASYERPYIDQLNNVFRLFFNQISSLFRTLLGPLGGRVLNNPCASFYTTTTQTAAAINTAYAINMDPAVFENGVYLGTPASRIYVDNDGVYNFQFSLQLAKSSASAGNIWIWYRVNGVDATYSASQVAVQGTSAQTVAAWNFVVEMNAGDYFELMWAVDDTHVEIIQYGTAAFRPAIPPVIMTVTFVSALTP